jgi:hypothetical protein
MGTSPEEPGGKLITKVIGLFGYSFSTDQARGGSMRMTPKTRQIQAATTKARINLLFHIRFSFH